MTLRKKSIGFLCGLFGLFGACGGEKITVVASSDPSPTVSSCQPEITLISTHGQNAINERTVDSWGVMTIGVRLTDATCGPITLTSLDFKATNTSALAEFMLIFFARPYPPRTIAGPRLTECQLGICERQINFEEELIVGSNSAWTFLELDVNPLYQIPASTFTPSVYGLSWRTSDGTAHHVTYPSPYTVAPIIYNVNL